MGFTPYFLHYLTFLIILIITNIRCDHAWVTNISPLHLHTRTKICSWTNIDKRMTKIFSNSQIDNESEENLLVEGFDIDDTDAKSQFGTHNYWEEMYSGNGDFPSDEYSWYYDWGSIQPYFLKHVPLSESMTKPKILIPGVGNDGIISNMYKAGYTNICAFDYSPNAIQRQYDLLSHNSKLNKALSCKDITLHVCDARNLSASLSYDGHSFISNYTDFTPSSCFDVIFEKGALDAIYLSSENEENLQSSVMELKRVLMHNGIFISVSGVVPEDVRRNIFNTDEWVWLRDGSNDLKAGLFVWKKK